MKNSIKNFLLAGVVATSMGLQTQAQQTSGSLSLQQNITQQDNVNRENKETVNNAIRIKAANAAHLSSVNGAIIIIGQNTSQGNISTTNGSVDVIGDNNGKISTKNGSIDIEDNNNFVETKNGNIKMKNNNGMAKAKNGDITVKGRNYKTIGTKNGSLTMIGDGLDVAMENKSGSSTVIIRKDRTIVVSGDYIENMTEGDEDIVSTQAGRKSVVVVNGKVVSEGENNLAFTVNNIKINFKDKKIITQGKTSSLVVGSIYEGIKVLDLSEGKIILQFQNQKISLSLEGILVEKI